MSIETTQERYRVHRARALGVRSSAVGGLTARVEEPFYGTDTRTATAAILIYSGLSHSNAFSI